MTDETNGPGREPVAWASYNERGEMDGLYDAPCEGAVPLYAAPPAAPRFCPNGRECLRGHLMGRAEEIIASMDPPAAPPEPAPDARVPNNDEVICPNCVHQFRAIPVNVQHTIEQHDNELADTLVSLGAARDEAHTQWKRAERAEAELAAARACIAAADADRDAAQAVIRQCARVMSGETTDDQGEAFDQCARLLDAARAAIKETK